MEKEKSAHARAFTTQIYTVQGEQLGWVDQLGYLHAFLPAAWVTPYGDLIGYMDSHGAVQLWGKQSQHKK